jgi:LacI family repressor for deo operon, udp, cdd, tsx, nupC, and nupG
VAVTLKDVARRASVSVRTVSNVVNGFPHVSDDVRRRVQAAVDELDYRPNLVARALRSTRTPVIALVVPDGDVARREEIARRVIAAAVDLGCVPVVDPRAAAAGRACLLVVAP